MIPFTEFLRQRHQSGACTTEDVLASFLPLARQVAAAHAAGKVAPLRGIAAVHADGVCLGFDAALVHEPSPGIGPAEPAYLPGYVSWEHGHGQHDPRTDLFVLGLILASLTCGLDLNEPEPLAEFVRQRHNLFELNPRLHPVLARAILRMTELDRHRRAQDLAALVATLENYRDQDIDFDLDLARRPAWASADRPGRRALILSCLQQRLFEISRRNRLLHFRATAQTVNLTCASVPLACAAESIRPEERAQQQAGRVPPGICRQGGGCAPGPAAHAALAGEAAAGGDGACLAAGPLPGEERLALPPPALVAVARPLALTQ